MSFSLIKEGGQTANSSFGYNNRIHARSNKELAAITKEIRLKRPNEVAYMTNSITLDQSDLMKRHRSNIANSKLQDDKFKSKSSLLIQRDISALLDPIPKTQNPDKATNKLLVALGVEIPETIFQMSNNISDLKQKLENSNFEILHQHDIGNDVNLEGFFNWSKTMKDARPAGNKDAEILEKWIDLMLEHISSEENKENDLFENAQIIYTAALQEIIRQVSMHCAKRGMLLERVWKAYFTLMVTAIKAYQNSKITHQMKITSDFKIIQSKYKEKIRVLKNKISEGKEEIASLSMMVHELKKTIDKAKIQEKIHQNKHSLLTAKYEKDKIKLLRLEDTNQNLNNLIQIVLEDIDSDLPGIKKLRQKNKIRFRDLTKMLTSDPLLQQVCSPTLELDVLEEDMDKMVEIEKIELEQKIFMQEINEKMQETEEELIDKAVDTREFITFQDKYSITELEPFVIPVVDVDKTVLPYKKPEYEDIIMKISTGDTIVEDADMKYYFNLHDLQDYSGSEETYEDLDVVPEEKYFELTDSSVTRLQIKDLMSTLHIKNVKKFEGLKKKIRYYKNKRNNFTKLLKEIRKALFIAVKENASLRTQVAELKNMKHRRVPSKMTKVPEKKKKFTTFKEFNLGRRLSRAPTKVNFDFTTVQAMIKKVVSGKYTEKLTVSKKGFIKLVNTFILDYLALPIDQTSKNRSLTNYFYSYICSKYNSKKIAEANFMQYIIACETYKKTSSIVNLFSRFVGVSDPLEIDYFNMFLDLSRILNTICKANEMIVDENEEMFVSLYRSEEATEAYWKGKITDLELAELRQKIESLEKVCPKNFNVCGVVTRLELMEVNINKLGLYLERAKNSVKDLFNGADLSGDGFLSMDEFELLFKNIEKQAYTPFYAKMLFTSYSDLIAELEGKEYPALSYNKFSFLCIEKGIFRIETQNQFLGIKDPSEMNIHIDNLAKNAENIIKQIKWRIFKAGEQKNMLLSMTNALKEQIIKGSVQRSTYVAYRLLEEDTKEKIVQKELKKWYPIIVPVVEKGQLDLGVDRNPPRRESRPDNVEESDEENLF